MNTRFHLNLNILDPLLKGDKMKTNHDLETTYFGVLKDSYIDSKGNFVIVSEDGEESKVSPKFVNDFNCAQADFLALESLEVNITTRKTTGVVQGKTKRTWKTNWFCYMEAL